MTSFFAGYFSRQCSRFSLEVPKTPTTLPTAPTVAIEDGVVGQSVSSNSAQDALPFWNFENTSPVTEYVHEESRAYESSQNLSHGCSNQQYSPLLSFQVSRSIVALLLHLSTGQLQCPDLEPSSSAHIQDIHHLLDSDSILPIDQWPRPLELALNSFEVDELVAQVSEQLPVLACSLNGFPNTDHWPGVEYDYPNTCNDNPRPESRLEAVDPWYFQRDDPYTAVPAEYTSFGPDVTLSASLASRTPCRDQSSSEVPCVGLDNNCRAHRQSDHTFGPPFIASIDRPSTTMTPAPLSSKAGYRKRKRLDPAQRTKVKSVRRMRACLRCRVYKVSVRIAKDGYGIVCNRFQCDENTPGQNRLKMEHTANLMKQPCYREPLDNVVPWRLGNSASTRIFFAQSSPLTNHSEQASPSSVRLEQSFQD